MKKLISAKLRKNLNNLQMAQLFQEMPLKLNKVEIKLILKKEMEHNLKKMETKQNLNLHLKLNTLNKMKINSKKKMRRNLKKMEMKPNLKKEKEMKLSQKI